MAQAALEELRIPELDRNKAFDYSPALFAAYANVLEELDRRDEAAEWFALSDRAVDALHSAYLAEGTESVAVEEELISAPSDADEHATERASFGEFATADSSRTESSQRENGEPDAEHTGSGEHEAVGSESDAPAPGATNSQDAATGDGPDSLDRVPHTHSGEQVTEATSAAEVALFDIEEDR